jgi:hypothetical protein
MRLGRQPNSLAICSFVFPLAKRLNNFFSCGESLSRSGDGICKLVPRSALTAAVGKLLSSPEWINAALLQKRSHICTRWRDLDLDQTIDVDAIFLMRGLPSECRSGHVSWAISGDLISWPNAREGCRCQTIP